MWEVKYNYTWEYCYLHQNQLISTQIICKYEYISYSDGVVQTHYTVESCCVLASNKKYILDSKSTTTQPKWINQNQVK